MYLLHQNIFLSSHWHRLISPPVLYRFHLDDGLVFSYRLQPILICQNLHRKQMLQHLSGHSSLWLNEYDIAGHDDHASHILRAEGSHEQKTVKYETFLLITSVTASTVSSGLRSDSSHTCTIPGRLTGISPLIQQWRLKRGICYYPRLQKRGGHSGRGISGRWEYSIHVTGR